MDNSTQTKVSQFTDYTGHTSTIIEGACALIPLTPRFKYHGKDYIMMFQDGIILMAKDKSLTGKDKDVLMYMIGTCGFENWVMISQKIIAKELNMKIVNISRAIRKMVKANYIKVVKRGGSNVYQINPMHVWKGNLKKHSNVVRMFQENSNSTLNK